MDANLLKYLDIRENSRSASTAERIQEKALQLASVHTWRYGLSMEDFAESFHPYYQSSQAIQKLLENSTHVYLLAVSLGSDIEDLAREFMKNNEPFKGFILDRMSSYLVEQEIVKLDSSVSSIAQSLGQTVTKRFSPGYRDFPLGAQQVFIHMIGSEIPGLKMSQGGIIKPEKTITALKGAKPANG